jgi:hypothetical protein
MAEKTVYHIYVNGSPVYVNLEEEEFEKEYSYLKGFLELTNLGKDAKIEYEELRTPLGLEASY